MGSYRKCPRCDLNWIKEGEDLCDVCKAELRLGGMKLIDDDEMEEETEERICPVCKLNPLDEGEEMCANCREEKLGKMRNEEKEDDDEDDESWREYVEEDTVEPVGEENEVFLSELEDDEADNEEDLESEEVFDDVDIAYDYDDDSIPDDENDEDDEDEDDFEDDVD